MGYNKQFLTNQALNVSSVSAAQQVGQTGLIGAVYSVEALFTGSTCSFAAKIQVSSEAIAPGSSDTSWADLANSSQSITTSGNFVWNVNEVGYVWIRLVITDNSSGSNNGSLTAIVNVNP